MPDSHQRIRTSNNIPMLTSALHSLPWKTERSTVKSRELWQTGQIDIHVAAEQLIWLKPQLSLGVAKQEREKRKARI